MFVYVECVRVHIQTTQLHLLFHLFKCVRVCVGRVVCKRAAALADVSLGPTRDVLDEHLKGTCRSCRAVLFEDSHRLPHTPAAGAPPPCDLYFLAAHGFVGAASSSDEEEEVDEADQSIAVGRRDLPALPFKAQHMQDGKLVWCGLPHTCASRIVDLKSCS
jgi:hypothetical protein